MYSWLVDAWATAGDAARCRQSLDGALERCGVDCVAETVARVAGAPEKKAALPLLRDVLRTAYDESEDAYGQINLVKLLAVAGDLPAARTRLNTLAREAVQLADGELVNNILDLDTEYRLLDRKSTDRVIDWLAASTPGGISALIPDYQPYQEKGWERWDR